MYKLSCDITVLNATGYMGTHTVVLLKTKCILEAVLRHFVLLNSLFIDKGPHCTGKCYLCKIPVLVSTSLDGNIY